MITCPISRFQILPRNVLKQQKSPFSGKGAASILINSEIVCLLDMSQIQMWSPPLLIRNTSLALTLYVRTLKHCIT